MDVQRSSSRRSDDKGEPRAVDDFYGWGRINAGAALGSVGGWQTVTPMPTATPTNTPTPTDAHRTPTPTNTPTDTPTPTPTPVLLRVNAGSDAAYQDWSVDSGYVERQHAMPPYTNLVAGTDDDPLYQKLREGMTQYQFTVPNGSYQVRLRFAEFVATKAGNRVMQISIEDAIVETGLDVYKTAGKAGALDRTYAASVADGVLKIVFTQVGGKYKPMVSAIEIRGGTPSATPTATWTPTATRTTDADADADTDADATPTPTRTPRRR